ncbi:MAG: transglutaminase family protein [Chloroflexi bacterium AL-W]|nr:transglutaminase family protein [Chloroflexi bacterium AL-N1]NOK68073.1 transglutaminase family protein [Chloroflexi bacterium AL-N10]NOK73413.1 transglutaminase family protein [Chloroflexi bacterium AL-N5]NOK83327.1 transglutaminase family protein [Chloroflexi bacterium AL-W]NOK87744.1 transglutaminase family protein [Chloroflexi bacterium AL-N15]
MHKTQIEERTQAMILNATSDILFDVSAPTPMILMLRPRSGAGQWIAREAYVLEPRVPITEYTDQFGNLCQRLIAPQGRFRIHTSADVAVSETVDVDYGAPFTPISDLPENVLSLLLPSRYCESDQMADLAQTIVADVKPGYDQVEAIRNWIHQYVTYQYQTSDASTSAVNTAHTRTGVCRDFAHLGIALCRSLSIPARMVVGYLYKLDPMDLHAWFEAFIGGRWYTFDATQATPRGGRIAIGYGRDAADVALTTQFGPATLTSLEVSVDRAKESDFHH